MKKILFVAIIILALLVCGFACAEQPGEGAENDKLLTVNYYDGTRLIETKEYSESFTPISYTKEGYTFIGWYLDKSLNSAFSTADMASYFTQKKLDLFAKTEEEREEMPQYTMKNFNIDILGKLSDTEYVVNPVFTWEDNGDSAYLVSLISDDKIVDSKEVSGTTYQCKKTLTKNTEYSFVVRGKQSNEGDSATFRTPTVYSNRALSIAFSDPFSNGAVLQRGKAIPVTGWGPVRQLISLTLNANTYYAISDSNGYFEVEIPAQPASFEPTEITVTNGLSCTASINDVLFGDVYLFSGQSNMWWLTRDSDYQREDIDNLIASKVRFYKQDITTASKPQNYASNGNWVKPDQNFCEWFSAISVMTGSFLGTALKDNVPVGVVTACQGDTNIANWMGEDYYDGSISTKHKNYNAMIYPLRGASFSGVVWYQGCNNSSIGCEYKNLLKSLFANYRDLFHYDEMPFFVIGLACYDGDPGNNFDFSFVRESQAKACAEDANAYFISTCDDGDPTYIHPTAKRYIAQRVAKSIGSVIYNNGLYAEGPSYKSHSVLGSEVTIEFNNAEGLTASGQINGFYLAGEDGKYHPATASILNGKIVASSEKVSAPVYIKYGFEKSPFVNIFNKDGYAAVPFRTDVYGTNIDLFEYDNLASYTYHPDGSEMSVSLVDGNLSVSKANDGIGFGSVRLMKWGAVAYQPECFTFTIIGTNSGARISLRFSEGGTGETWGYQIVDDAVGVKTVIVDVSDLTVLYNAVNSVFEPQKIGFVEIMVENDGGASFTLCGAKFVNKIA